MSGRQAKILSKDSCDDLLVFASTTRHPLRNRLIVLLSVKAGLRAAEIANLTWEMVLTPTAEIGPAIELHDCAAKKSGGRLIPIHPELREALGEMRSQTDATGRVIRSQRGGPMTPVSIVNWFAKAYRTIGLRGCSSHSGRRTFITRAARLVHNAGA
jgi:integrase